MTETELNAVDLHRKPAGAGAIQGDVEALLNAELPPGEEAVLLAQPRGFCAGVDRAITIVERALALHGAPIYVRHEIVHNDYVVSNLREKGAVFVEELDEVPDGATVIFSAHGVSRAVRAEAAGRGLHVFDATCPLVTKVHVEVTKMRKEGHHVIMIGHAGHPEVQGTMGQADDGIYLVETEADVERLQVPDGVTLAYVTQTTLSVDDCRAVIEALRRRFPHINEPKKQDICYATQNRQDAVKFMAPQCDLVLIIGSPSSSNSNRLREVAERHGCEAYLIGSAAELKPEWVAGRKRVGVSAGASAPEILVDELVARLKELGARSVRPLEGVEENMAFPLPKGLSLKKQQAEARRKAIEEQLAGSQYGIAYTDGAERITQLNRPSENNLMSQIQWLTTQLYNQLGMTEDVFTGKADARQMLNYQNRTVRPVLKAITDAITRTFLTKTARTQRQRIMAIEDPFLNVPLEEMSKLVDSVKRNEIGTANELRPKFGWAQSEDETANQLVNSNINPMGEEQPPGEEPVDETPASEVPISELMESSQNGS